MSDTVHGHRQRRGNFSSHQAWIQRAINGLRHRRNRLQWSSVNGRRPSAPVQLLDATASATPSTSAPTTPTTAPTTTSSPETPRPTAALVAVAKAKVDAELKAKALSDRKAQAAAAAQAQALTRAKATAVDKKKTADAARARAAVAAQSKARAATQAKAAAAEKARVTAAKSTAARKKKQESAAPVGGSGATFYQNCTAVRAAGADPVYAGQPGYSRKLDRDGDGIACE